jgi:hypothetical protein
MHNQMNNIEATSPAVELVKPPARRKSNRLSDAALVLLSHAANRDDGMVLPPPAALRARGGALTVLLTNLLERALIEEVPVDNRQHGWRSENDVWIGLRISALGLHAIGLEPQVGGQPDGLAAAEGLAATAAEILPLVAVATNEAALSPDSTGTSSTVVPGASTRRISKQEHIVALLGLADGASIETLMATTDWLPHTVRAALSGLRKKGHVIARRQNADGTSVYFIAPSSQAAASAGDLS